MDNRPDLTGVCGGGRGFFPGDMAKIKTLAIWLSG